MQDVQNLSRSILKTTENIPKHAISSMQLQSQNNERTDFLLYFTQNTLHLRYVASEFQQQEAVQNKERVYTPLSTKEFLIHFYEPDGTKTLIRQVKMQRAQGGRPESLIVLCGVLDTLIFRLPLQYFYVQVMQKKLTAMSFTMKPAELQQITRNYDRFKNIQQIVPLTTEQYIAYDENHQSLVLFNLSDVTYPTIRLRHSHTQFPLVQQPTNIFIDRRGLKQAQIVSGNQIWLIHDRLGAVDIFEYFRGTQGRSSLDIRESEVKNGVISKYSYFKQLFPLTQLPQGFRPEVNKLISSSAVVSSDQFLVVICMGWLPGEATITQNNLHSQFQTDQSMIQHLKPEFFQAHNVFVFNTKKLVSALALDYVADLAATTPDGSILYLGNQQTGMVGQFKVNQHQQLVCEAVQQIAQPIKALVAGKYHAMCVNQQNGVVCFKKAGQLSTPVSIWCPQSFGSIHLPKQPKKDQMEKSVKFGEENDYNDNRSGIQRVNTTNQSYQQNKSIMETEILDRLKHSNIPGVDNSQNLVSSLFSPANESMRRRRLQSKFYGLGSELDDILNEPMLDSQESDGVATIGSIQELAMKTGDNKLDEKLVQSVINQFQHYYALYEKLRIIEEYIILLLNPKVDDQLIQKLPKGMKQLFDDHIADCAITVANARYFIGYQEFYYQEMRYVNSRIQQLLLPFKEDFNLDMYQIEMIQQFVDGQSVVSNFLNSFHEQIDEQLDDVNFSIADIYGVIYQEFIDQQKAPLSGQVVLPKQSSVMDLVAQKTQQLTEYFRQISLYRTKALAAFQYAATRKDSSILQSAKLDGIPLDIANNPKYHKSLSGQARMISDVAGHNDIDLKKQLNSQEVKNFQNMPDEMFDQIQKLTEMRQNEGKQSSVVQMPKKPLEEPKLLEVKPESPGQQQHSKSTIGDELERAKKLKESMQEMQRSLQQHLDQSRSSNKPKSTSQISRPNREVNEDDSYSYIYVYEDDDEDEQQFAIEHAENAKKRKQYHKHNNQKEKEQEKEYNLEEYNGSLSSDDENNEIELSATVRRTQVDDLKASKSLGSTSASKKNSPNSQVVPHMQQNLGKLDAPMTDNQFNQYQNYQRSPNLNNSIQKLENGQQDNGTMSTSQKSVVSTVNTTNIPKNNVNQIQNNVEQVTSAPITQERISAQYQGPENMQGSNISAQLPFNGQDQNQTSPSSIETRNKLIESYNQNFENISNQVNIQKARIQRMKATLPLNGQIRLELQNKLTLLDEDLNRVLKQLQSTNPDLQIDNVQNIKYSYALVENKAQEIITSVQNALPQIERQLQEAVIAESQVNLQPPTSQRISSNIHSRSASNMTQSRHEQQPYQQQGLDNNLSGYGSMHYNQSPARNPFRNVKENYPFQGMPNMYHNREYSQDFSQISGISNNSFINTSFYRENIGKVNINTDKVSDQIQHMSRQELQHYLDVMNYNRQSLLKVGYKIRQSTFRQDMENLPKMPQSKLMRKIAQNCNNQQIQVQSEKRLIQPKNLQYK